MVQCPECSKSVEADFGMTTCPHCGTVFMVEIDGSIQDSTSEEVVHEEPPQELPSFEEANQPEPITDAPSYAYESASESLDSQEPVNELPLEESSQPDATDVDNNFFSNDEPTNEPAQEASTEETTDPLGLEKFDSSAGAELSEGELIYDVSVLGLDSSDIKREIFSALMDKRFALSAEDLKRNLKEGVLTIKNINPVRAMLMVLKLQEYDVDVEWRQRHYARPEASVEESV